MESLADRMSSMHLHHVGIPTNDEASCKKRFSEELRKWTGDARRRKSYTGVCRKGNDESKHCKYVIKIFHMDDQKNPAVFRQELRVLRDLHKKHVKIVPHVHHMFTCGRYGLLVMDKWEGDLLELIFSRRQFHLRSLHMKVREMVQSLHQVGWTHGHIRFQNIVFQGDQLGLLNWDHARSLSLCNHEHDDLLMQSDLDSVDVMFLELGQTVAAIESGEHLPENLPIALKNRFQKNMSVK